MWRERGEIEKCVIGALGVESWSNVGGWLLGIRELTYICSYRVGR